MSKLIILRGNSGSGKTTIAKELQKKIGSNTLVISQDAIRREMLMVSDGPDTLALPLLKDLLRYGKEHCETVIWKTNRVIHKKALGLRIICIQ